MEKLLVDAIRAAWPMVDIYHDFAPEEADFPCVIIQRVGGRGKLFVDYHTSGGYQVRYSVSVWARGRIEAVEKSRLVESALVDLPLVHALGAAEAVTDTDTGLRGMVQDFIAYGD